jgi:Zn-dependent protease
MPVENLHIIPILLFSVIVHEVSHGWMALRLGDTTARDAGRITFNPIPHIDPVGSVLLPAILIMTGASFFLAWAKPVPVNSANFQNPRRDDILVSAIGPFSNLVVAFFCAVGFAAVYHLVQAGDHDGTTMTGYAAEVVLNMLSVGVPINIVLALFNLIPVPPLDGSHILASLLPDRWAAAYRQVGFAGILVLLLAMRWEPFQMVFSAARAWLQAPFDLLIRLLV